MTDLAAPSTVKTDNVKTDDAETDNVVPLAKRDRVDHRAKHDQPATPDQSPPTEPLLRDLFGRVIRRARHDQGRTLVEVAAEAGVSVPYLSEMERGRKEPSSEMLAAVCRALSLDLVDLVSRTYVDLVAEREAQALDAPRPIAVRTARGHRVGGGHSGDVLALAA